MSLAIDQILHSLQPTLQELEKERIAIKKVLPFLLLPPLIALLLYLLFPEMILLSFGILVIGFGSIGALYAMRSSRYRTRYKNQIVPSLVQAISPELHFDATAGISSEEFDHSELFRSDPDRYSTEDLLWGRYGKTDLKLAEVHAESRQRDKDGKTTYSTIFKGMLFIADFHKNFQGRTFVMPDTAERFFGGFGRALQGIAGRANTDLLQLEDPEFEKFFAAHSSDQIEGRYILSSSMMQRILTLRSRFGQSNIRLAFKDSAIWIAVPYRRDFLEASARTPATDTQQIQSFLDELQVFLELVDELNLNTRIWTKK